MRCLTIVFQRKICVVPGNRSIFASEKGNKFKSNTLNKGFSKRYYA